MFVVLFILWMVLNGQCNLEIVCFGFVISGAVFWFGCRYLDYSLKKELGFYRLFPHIFVYFLVLVREIVKANVDAIRLALSFRFEIDPVVVKFKTDLKTDMAKAILANSITLTPGTITISVEGDEFTVHALDRDLVQGICESVFVKRLRKMETLAEESR